MTWKEIIIPISSVDIEDNTFKITTNENTDDLAGSILSVGIINPPFLIRKKSEYLIVSGFRRVVSAKSLGWDQLPARVLEPETGGIECVKLAISENLHQRALNLIETSRCYKLLSKYFEHDALLSEASSIGLSGNPGLIKKIMRLSDLPPFIQSCVISETVSLGMVLELGEFENETGVAFAKIFNLLRPSLNKQREIVSLAREIALRENIPIVKLITDEIFTNIISDENSDRNVKIRKIRDFLKARRFPAITKAERVFENKVKKLGLPAGIKLIPPAGFEGNIFIISVEFKNISEFNEQMKCLDKMINRPVLIDILSKQLSD